MRRLPTAGHARFTGSGAPNQADLTVWSVSRSIPQRCCVTEVVRRGRPVEKSETSPRFRTSKKPGRIRNSKSEAGRVRRQRASESTHQQSCINGGGGGTGLLSSVSDSF